MSFLSCFIAGATGCTSYALSVSAFSISLPLSDFDPWWTNDCEQNESEPIPANCTGCAQKHLKVMLLEDAPRKFERLHPLVIKVSRSLSLPLIGCLLKG